MPDNCCVTACKSNYDGTGIYVSVFQFPKDTSLKEKWIKKIPRKDFVPSKRSVVCEKHFAADAIVRFDELPLENGEILQIKRERPKLISGAIPTMFPGCPSYLSEKEQTVKRVSRDIKLKKVDEAALQSFLLEDKVGTYVELREQFSKKIQLPNNTTTLESDVNMYILFLCLDSMPKITKSIKINSDMSISVYFGEIETTKHYKHLLQDFQITHWSQLENIISMLNSKLPKDISHYDAAVEHWEHHIKDDTSSSKNKTNQFLLEQLHLYSKQKAARRYSSDMFRFASCIYLISPSCYKALLNCNVLVLPCVDSLKKILNVLSLSTSTVSLDNINYIKAKCNRLKEEEKLVNLLIDEIHIKRKIVYKGKHVSGFAENNDADQHANSVQAFMITSCFSKYKEVVALVPVCSMTAQDLYKLTKQTLEILHKAGFEVLSIISDNNSVNRNMFCSMANGTLTSSPVINPVTGSNLYLLFDAVHILKCLRNNWLNQLDTEKTFVCPDFSGVKDITRPRFGLLRKAFHIEEQSTIKYAFHLNAKSLYPTNIERQNVQPAVNIFHESNPVALERLSKHHLNSIHTVEDTAAFLRLIKKWWDIMNVSHQNKGKFTRNPDSLPLSAENGENLVFLSRFVEWLAKWKNMKQVSRNGCLTKETFFALIQTSSTMINIANVLIKDGAKYVLTTKFHTDALEFRFSQYRQMSGCNYHVSLQQVLESERKLRIKSVLHLHSHEYGDIPMRLFINELCYSEVHEVELKPFLEIVDDLIINVSSNESEILTYIAGYCVYKLKLTCDSCKMFYYGAFDLSVDLDEELLLSPLEKVPHTEYLDMVNRGGMKTPSSNVVFTLSVCFIIFQKLISSEYESIFMSYNIKQHTVLVQLTELYLKHSCIFDLMDICPDCNACFSKGISKGIKAFSNVCLNNYAKNKSDQSVLNKQKTKENNVECKKESVVKNKGSKKSIKCVERKVKKFKK